MLLETSGPNRMREVRAAMAVSTVHALVHRIGRRTVSVLDVVGQPDVVEAQVLGHLELVDELLQ